MAKQIEDFGEKIGGARKDWRAGNITAQAYDEMNALEKEEFATKDQIWPRPDYKDLVTKGMPLELAFRIKCLRDSIPSYIPPQGKTWRWSPSIDPEARRRGFVEAVNILRDSAMECKSVADFIESTQGIYHRLPEESSMALRMRLPHQRRTLPPSAFFSSGAPNLEYFTRKFNDAVREGFPDPKAVTARKAKIEYPERILATNPTRGGLHDYRKGVNATPEMFMETFGLRGGEFGNWVDQTERQVSLNMAFDAFCDLADVLEIPKKQIGLNGTLSLAFGARGTGGRGAAAAHYECARRVINLTKPHGAGALCHEWFHAVDHYIGAGKDDVRAFATNGVALEPASDESAKRFKEALHIMKERDQTHEEARFEHVERLEDHKTKVIDYVTKIYKYAGISLSPDSPHSEMWDKIHDRIKSGDLSAAKEMIPTYKKEGAPYFVKVNSPEKLTSFVDFKEESYKKTAAIIEGDVYPPKRVKTGFYERSRYWDDLRKKDYYTIPHEMTARAFEAHIEQSLEDQGAKNEYLVYGTQTTVYPLGSDRDGRLSAFGHLTSTAIRSILGSESPEENRDLPAVANELARRANRNVYREPSLDRPDRPIPIDTNPLSQGKLF